MGCPLCSASGIPEAGRCTLDENDMAISFSPSFGKHPLNFQGVLFCGNSPCSGSMIALTITKLMLSLQFLSHLKIPPVN